MSTQEDPRAVLNQLTTPFAIEDVEFKPATVSGNRALALAYADARVYMDRLDLVLGCNGWQTTYEVIGDHSVKCRLLCRIGAEWIGKEDVGSTSDQPDPGDQMKAAFSDALKRAAVQFGVGRYLYSLPRVWADYDPKTRQFVRPPTLPPWAIPVDLSKQKVSDSTRETIRRECLRSGFNLKQVIEAAGCGPFKVLADASQEVGDKLVAWLKTKPNDEPMTAEQLDTAEKFVAANGWEVDQVHALCRALGGEWNSLTKAQATEIIRQLSRKPALAS